MRCRPNSTGQVQSHTRAATFGTAEFELAVVQAGDGTAYRQAESAALAQTSLGSMEALAQAGHIRRDKPRAIVVDFQGHSLGLTLDAHVDLALSGGMAQCVVEEIVHEDDEQPVAAMDLVITVAVQ